MKQARNDNEETPPDESRRRLRVGWSSRLRGSLTGLTDGDVTCMIIAVSISLVVVAIAFGIDHVWDRVSTLWE